MFLSLEHPEMKGVMLVARDLAGDEGFDPMHRSFDFDSERSRVNRVINRVNDLLGDKPHKAFSMLFNQYTWKGTTGWEYWSDNYPRMLTHALLVAQSLGVPLHVHDRVACQVIEAAAQVGITLDFADPVLAPEPNTDDMRFFIDRCMANGEYAVLTGVTLPDSVPAAPQLD